MAPPLDKTLDQPFRPRCSVFIAVSLDGYIAREDGSIDWLSIVECDGEDYGYRAFSDRADTLLFGRHTYDTVLGFGEWPYETKRCIVLTHRPAASRHGELFWSGSPAEIVARLTEVGAQRVYLDGGITIRSFLTAGLVDELTLSIIPILLGRGIPLFGPELHEQRLTLEHSTAFPSGLVQHRYRLG